MIIESIRSIDFKCTIVSMFYNAPTAPTMLSNEKIRRRHFLFARVILSFNLSIEYRYNCYGFIYVQIPILP